MSTPAESIRTARLFDFYVKVFWPIHRYFVKGRLSRRCTVCAASERMVSLDASRLCELCRKSGQTAISTERVSPDLQKQLNAILKDYEGRGPGQYDALCLYSGGKDSTYLIHRIRSGFPGLRILAFTIDNGFMSPVAKENVNELIEKLKVDHLFVRPDTDFYKKLFQYCLTHLNEDGGYGTVDFSDGEFMLDTARALAAEKGIPLILCGYSRFQVQDGLKLKHFESPRKNELSDRTATAGIPLSDIFSEAELKRWWHGSAWPSERVARLLFPLYAWDLEEFEIKRKVTEWGLLTKKEYSPIVTNHRLIPLIGVVDVHQKGYSSFEKEFCRMIRGKKANKKEWQPVFEFLEYTSKTGFFVKKLVTQLLEELGLEEENVGIKYL